MHIITSIFKYLGLGLIGLTIFYVAFILKGGLSPDRQIRNMHAAAAYGEQVWSQIKHQKQYSLIEICEATTLDGCLSVHGFVPTIEDEAYLRSLIYTPSLPTKVKWDVHVTGAAAFDDAVKALLSRFQERRAQLEKARIEALQ